MVTYINNYKRQFEYYKSLSDKSIEQISKTDIFLVPSIGSNSISVIMKHIAGNMLSRWTDIFNTDGEKSWRNRDQEFTTKDMSYEEVIDYWEKGWTCLYRTLDTLTDDHLNKTIYIRNMGHTVQEAIIRQLCHYSYHIGQIVYASKIIAEDDFLSLSIPKGNSIAYNKEKFSKEKRDEHFTNDL